VLTIKGGGFTHTSPYPLCPRLHTLRFHSMAIVHSLRLTRQSLPSLRTLELIDTLIRAPICPNETQRTLPPLEHLRLFGWAPDDYGPFENTIVGSHFRNTIRELTIGLRGHRRIEELPFLRNWDQMPPSLETLHIVSVFEILDQDALDVYGGKVRSDGSWDSFGMAFKRGMDKGKIRKLKALRRVIINFKLTRKWYTSRRFQVMGEPMRERIQELAMKWRELLNWLVVEVSIEDAEGCIKF